MPHYGLSIISRGVTYYVRREPHPVTRGRWTADPSEAMRWATEDEAFSCRHVLGGRPIAVELPEVRGRFAALDSALVANAEAQDSGAPTSRRCAGLEV